MKQPIPYRQYQRIVRTLRGPFTQTEAAETAKVNIQNLQDWEAGRSRPSKPALRRLIDHYTSWLKHFELEDTFNNKEKALTLILDLPDDDPKKEE